jgi:hypothetical protein
MRVTWLLFVVLTLIPRGAAAQGNPLGPEFRVNTYTTSYQVGGSVAADSSGNFVVVWSSQGQDGSSTGVFGQRYASSGTPLGPEFRVNTYTTTGQNGGSVASDPSGNFVVVWTDYGQGISYDGWWAGGVFGQRYASSGVPLGSEFRVNTHTAYNQRAGAAATDASGNFVVVWESFEGFGSGWSVFGQRYASSGTPLGSEFLVMSGSSPSVATDPSGNFVVVWTGGDGSGFGVFGQRYASSGAPLGPDFRVNTYTAGNQRVSCIATDASGNFVVAWLSRDQDGSNYGVFGQRYAGSGTPVGPEFRVNTHTTGSQGYPSVAADPSGNFVVGWNSDNQDGSNVGVFGQRYASSGAPLGPEFRVNSYTTNSQTLGSVALDPSGNFIFIWNSNTQDGSSYGVFGQRYGRIVPVELMHFRIE